MSSFAYLQSVMARYGDEELLVFQNQERIATALTESDVESLAASYAAGNGAQPMANGLLR